MFTILRLKTVDSTNKYAKELIESNSVSSETIILAHEQTAGKGQAGNFWESETGKNLTFSIILFPNHLHASAQFRLTQIVSLAVCDTLALYLTGHSVRIKWPNDIYVGMKKIAGILIENQVMGNYLSSSVIGIGININQKQFLSDAPNPISLIQLTTIEYDIDIILQQFIKNFEKRIQESNYSPSALHQRYLDSLLFYHQWQHYQTAKEQFEGFITDVNEYGQLCIRKRNGTKKDYNFKEIGVVF